MHKVPNSPQDVVISERVRSILAGKGLTLSKVSHLSLERFGRSSPGFIPPTFYYQLRIPTFSPSLHQIFALSQISRFRFTDWVRVFGFGMDSIPQFQILLPAKRTMLLDSSWTDPEAWVPWFENRASGVVVPAIAPLPQLLRASGNRQIRSLPETGSREFLYAKVGHQDVLAFPDLLPGSIVRVNPSFAGNRVPQVNDITSGRIFLIEHNRGFFCSRLRVVGNSVVVPVSPLLSYAQVELQIPNEARIIGAVDLEIRPLVKHRVPEVTRDLARQWKPLPLRRSEKLGELLRSARRRMRLSLREAAAMSRSIANILGDERFVVSPSSLHDYELFSVPPRDFHKSIALCLVYGMDFRTFLAAIGIAIDQIEAEPMPEHVLTRAPRAKPPEEHPGAGMDAPSGFLEQLLNQCQDVPFFLRDSIASFYGLPGSVMDSCFWIGGQRDVLYPYLSDGLLALVNHRKRRPFHFTSKPVWQQPVYMMLLRDGTYQCACCGVENGTLVVHPYPQQFHRTERLRHHSDAEIVGQVVAVARKLP